MKSHDTLKKEEAERIVTVIEEEAEEFCGVKIMLDGRTVNSVKMMRGAIKKVEKLREPLPHYHQGSSDRAEQLAKLMRQMHGAAERLNEAKEKLNKALGRKDS